MKNIDAFHVLLHVGGGRWESWQEDSSTLLALAADSYIFPYTLYHPYYRRRSRVVPWETDLARVFSLRKGERIFIRARDILI